MQVDKEPSMSLTVLFSASISILIAAKLALSFVFTLTFVSYSWPETAAVLF